MPMSLGHLLSAAAFDVTLGASGVGMDYWPLASALARARGRFLVVSEKMSCHEMLLICN